jgi:hypothetical protein
VTDRVDTSVKGSQVPAQPAPVDRLRSESQVDQLRLRDHAVLFACEPLDREVRRALLISICGIAGAHGAVVSRRVLRVDDVCDDSAPAYSYTTSSGGGRSRRTRRGGMRLVSSP